MEIAKTILNQMGGNRLAIMTGAKSFMAHEDGLSFRLPGRPGYTKDGINYVRVRLNGLDLYDVEYGRIWGQGYKVRRQAYDLFATDLMESFRHATGLETRMPKVEGITC